MESGKVNCRHEARWIARAAIHLNRGDGSIRNTFDGGNDLPHGMTMPGSEIKRADVSIRQICFPVPGERAFGRKFGFAAGIDGILRMRLIE